MKRNLIKIIAVILLMAFIMFAAFAPALAGYAVADDYIFHVFMHMVFLMLMGICFFPFTIIILSTHKLE